MGLVYDMYAFTEAFRSGWHQKVVTLSLVSLHARALLLVSLGLGFPTSLVQSVQHVCSHFPRKPILGPGLTTGFTSAMHSHGLSVWEGLWTRFLVSCYARSRKITSGTSCYFGPFIIGVHI